MLNYSKWQPLKTFSDIRAAEGTPIRVLVGTVLNTDEDVLLNVGQTVHFSTSKLDAVGVVLAIDHGAVYPIQMQYKVSGDSRISSFSPDDFIYLDTATQEYKL